MRADPPGWIVASMSKNSKDASAQRKADDLMEDAEAVNLAADWADISQGLRKDLGQQLHSQWIKPIQVGGNRQVERHARALSADAV